MESDTRNGANEQGQAPGKRTAPTQATAHLAALATVTVWGVTFISTKVLLADFEPVEILFCRFAIGFLALCVLRPRILRLARRRDELLFAAAGITGTCLYFLLENIALQYATAGNISVTVSTAPLFTAIIATIIGRERAITPSFVAGFVVAILGIVLISRSDMSTDFASLGDLLAVAAAITWGIYSNIIRRLGEKGYETIAMTKRIFAWGLLFIALLMPFMGAHPDFARFLKPQNWGNLLFLGIGASACCFVSWGFVVSKLGTARASSYIYLSPAITVLAGVVFLEEPFTGAIALGLLLVSGGLVLSQMPPDAFAKLRRSITRKPPSR